jgi:hypothetical protein
MPFELLPGVTLYSTPNKLVSTAAPAPGAAAECWVAINPRHPERVVCAVREVPSLSGFAYSVITMYYSGDSGSSWKAAPPLSLTPPAPDAPFGGNGNASVAWDNNDNAYLLTFAVTADFKSLAGIAFYKSTDGFGAIWTGPAFIHRSGPGIPDDKPIILVDTGGRFEGRLYAVWMSVPVIYANQILFARSDDQGATWSGTGMTAAGTILGGATPWPSAAISPDGDVYIAYPAPTPTGTGFQVQRSADGGNTFVKKPAVGGVNLYFTEDGTVTIGSLPESADYLDGGNFRANSFFSVCAGSNGLVLCAWLEQITTGKDTYGTRIHYQGSFDGGNSWQAAPGGTLLSRGKGQYHFSPQFSITPSGIIVCNYYSYQPTTANTGDINVWAQVSYDQGQTFTDAVRVNDATWNTAIPMIALGVVDNIPINFIGDYFGLAAGRIGTWGEGFISTWTDGRNFFGIKGNEEIYSAQTFIGPKFTYVPDEFWPFPPYDPGGPWAWTAAILTGITLVLIGGGITMLNSLTRVPGLLPVSVGLFFGSALLYILSFYVFKKSSARANISQVSPFSKNLVAAGIILTLAGLVLPLLPASPVSHERAVPVGLYSALITCCLVMVFYVLIRISKRAAK